MDVIVSMKDSGHRMVYHRPECIYVRRMKRENRIRLDDLFRQIEEQDPEIRQLAIY